MKTAKIIVLDSAGVTRAGVKYEARKEEHEVPRGPHLDAWLRFGQVKLVEQKPVSEKK